MASAYPNLVRVFERCSATKVMVMNRVIPGKRESGLTSVTSALYGSFVRFFCKVERNIHVSSLELLYKNGIFEMQPENSLFADSSDVQAESCVRMPIVRQPQA